jgi:hypothetical protein
MVRGTGTAIAVTLATLVNLSIPPSLPVHADPAEPLNPPVAGSAYQGTSEVPSSAGMTGQGQDLAAIVESIEPISQATRVRRNIAHATFCLPQNVLGTLYYGLLRLTGNVVGTAEMNETKIIVTSTPFGASLGKYIFVHTTMQTENTVRHEYGHTLQGYKHGPFYLLFEGLTSFVQAAISLVFPSFAEGYFDRWPENEANTLGGVT